VLGALAVPPGAYGEKRKQRQTEEGYREEIGVGIHPACEKDRHQTRGTRPGAPRVQSHNTDTNIIKRTETGAPPAMRGDVILEGREEAKSITGLRARRAILSAFHLRSGELGKREGGYR